MRGSMIRVKSRVNRVAHYLSGNLTMVAFPMFHYLKNKPENRQTLAAELRRRRALYGSLNVDAKEYEDGTVVKLREKTGVM